MPHRFTAKTSQVCHQPGLAWAAWTCSLDESQEFAERLESAGIDVDFVVYEGAFHGFEHIVPEALTTKKRHADLIEAMRGVLVKTNPGTSD